MYGFQCRGKTMAFFELKELIEKIHRVIFEMQSWLTCIHTNLSEYFFNKKNSKSSAKKIIIEIYLVSINLFYILRLCTD